MPTIHGPDQTSDVRTMDTGDTISPELLMARIESLEKELAEVQGLATLGTLAGSIAHEFNNILTPILTFAELALEAPEDRELTHRALRKALEGSERASFIASALLGFARQDDGVAECDVRRVVRDVQACLVRDPKQDGIEVAVDVPDGLTVRMSPSALHQVVLNLILNALEAMRGSGGRLTIEARCSTRNTPPTPRPPCQSADQSAPGQTRGTLRAAKQFHGDGVRLVIRDTGPGLPESVKAHLFEPFRRGKAALGARRGSGLGLSVCNRLVQEAGGSIEATSEHGRGTAFEIWLAQPANDKIAAA